MSNRLPYIPGVSGAPPSLGPWGPSVVASINAAIRALNNPRTLASPSGAVPGDPSFDNAAAFAKADVSDVPGSTYVSSGVFYILSDLTLSSDWVFASGAQINVASGKTVTFNGNLDNPPTNQAFAGSGSIVLAGQRQSVYAEWWGAKADSSVDSSPPLQAAIDALTNGGVIRGLNGIGYLLGSDITVANKVDYIGAGRGINPTVGGTTFRPTSALALTTTALFSFSTGSTNWRDFQIIGPTTTNPALLNYIGLRTLTGSGTLTFSNIEMRGIGTGLDLQGGSNGVIDGIQVYAYAHAGLTTGGTANVFSAEWRLSNFSFSNSSTAFVTTGTTAIGNDVLVVTSTASMVVGQGVSIDGLPTGSKVLTIVDATHVQVDHVATGAIPSGRNGIYGYFVVGIGIYIKDNSFNVTMTNFNNAGGDVLAKIEYAGGAGMQRPNAIWFENADLTASASYGVYISGGTSIRFKNSWIAGVMAGPAMYCSALSGVAADLEGVILENCLIGTAAQDGIIFDVMTNPQLNNCRVVGNGQSLSNTYIAVYCSSNCVGQFQMIGGIAGNLKIEDVFGQEAYGLYLAAGSFAGTGDSVAVLGTRLSGLTAPGYADGSTPAGTLKLFEPVYA